MVAIFHFILEFGVYELTPWNHIDDIIFGHSVEVKHVKIKCFIVASSDCYLRHPQTPWACEDTA